MTTGYQIIKTAHILFAGLSITGFVVRGIWMLQGSARLQRRWVRVVPHVNDTLLLATAVILVVLSGQYPGATAWLNAKLIALCAYIGLGVVAFRLGRSRRTRVLAWSLAVCVFAYIVMVAITRQPLPVLRA